MPKPGPPSPPVVQPRGGGAVASALAPHVQAAVQVCMGPRLGGQPGGKAAQPQRREAPSRLPAPHVRAAVQACAGPAPGVSAAQPQRTGAAPQPLSLHVRTAVQACMAPPSAPQPAGNAVQPRRGGAPVPAPHVQAAVQACALRPGGAAQPRQNGAASRAFAPHVQAVVSRATAAPSAVQRQGAVPRLLPPAPGPHFASSRRSVSILIQLKWIDAGNKKLCWDKPMQGLLWFFNPENQTMAFKIVDDSEKLTPYKSLENKWQAHGDWLKLGWGLFLPKKEEKKEEENVLKKFFEDGQRRYKRLESAKGKLSKKSQASRDWFFKNYYTQDAKHSSDPENIKTNYNYLPPSARQNPSKNGQYVNQFDLAGGRIVADQNYGLEGGEMYYDMETETINSMSNSEILYQQWKVAKSQAEEKTGEKVEVAPIRVLRRAHVAGEVGRKLTMAIRKKLNHTRDATFTPKDEEFYMLLGAPNAIAAIWLVCDHGQEMGIQGIGSITLKSGNSIEINFIN
jgi:hypothetical protein